MSDPSDATAHRLTFSFTRCSRRSLNLADVAHVSHPSYSVDGGRAGGRAGWQILPLILMFVMFGPVILTGVIFVCDWVVNSEWAQNIGLADDPRTRLTKFYKKHNPANLQNVREEMMCV